MKTTENYEKEYSQMSIEALQAELKRVEAEIARLENTKSQNTTLQDANELKTSLKQSIPTVFLSYDNTGNEVEQVADKLQQRLEKAGVTVITQKHNMRAGQRFIEFYQSSIKEARFTVSLISEKTLTSGLLAYQQVFSLEKEKFSTHHFIPCFTGSDLLSHQKVEQVYQAIETEIESLNAMIKKALDNNRPYQSLQWEKDLYAKLHQNLDGIVARLKQVLTLDISGSGFEAATETIIATLLHDLETGSHLAAEHNVPETEVSKAIQELKNEMISRLKQIDSKLDINTAILQKLDTNQTEVHSLLLRLKEEEKHGVNTILQRIDQQKIPDTEQNQLIDILLAMSGNIEKMQNEHLTKIWDKLTEKSDSMKSKFKLTIPIIPLFLRFEHELGIDGSLRKLWNKWRRVVL